MPKQETKPSGNQKKAVRYFEKGLAKLAKKKKKHFINTPAVKQKLDEVYSTWTNLTEPWQLQIRKRLKLSFFSSVFTVKGSESLAVKKSMVQELAFTVSDVEKQLIALKPDESPGPDTIHPRVLRELANEVVYPLYIIFKKSLSDSELPASWKLGHITPIFKKGSKSEASNYRPVSLTSVVCKTLEHLVRADIMKHMWENKLLSDYQGCSCTSQLLADLEAWTCILDSGNAVDAIYLDFRKAFDTVPHKRLLAKLEGYE